MKPDVLLLNIWYDIRRPGGHFFCFGCGVG